MSVGDYAAFKTALGQYESGNNYAFVSSLQYLGRWQFSEESLKAAGFYQGDATSARDYIGAWTPLAESFGVNTKASFLASPAAQDAALESWFKYVENDIRQLGLEKYEGQTLNGVTITGSGLYAGTHLVGVWALKSFLESGGTSVPQDGYGTTVVTYLTNFGGYDVPFSFSHAGPDTLVGGGGADRLFGGAGDDHLSGGGGSNYLRGGDGNDTLMGAGFDDLHGNKGDDRIDGGSGGDDWLVGGQGSDVITAHAGGAVLYGNMGADTLNGGSGSEILRGGQDDDVIYGGAGSDWISGDRGDDTLSGGSGGDLFNTFKGAGLDRVLDFNAGEGDRVRIEGGSSYTLLDVGGDTVVDLGDGDRLVLAGVKLASLPVGWIV